MELGQVALTLIFGANACIYGVFFLANRASRGTAKDDQEKESQGLVSFQGLLHLSSEIFRCGLILLLTYLCEKHPLFDHSEKQYNSDSFVVILILFFIYAIYTLQPSQDLSLLGREQTDEWRGWMQVIFLLYHYFKADVVYNLVRVLVSAYVWMTGFGNFSYFYSKDDYSWLRVLQMLWRLNFAVLLLMCTHTTTYILYYICPLHTIYFMLTFFTMFTFSRLNYTKWGIRSKLFIVGVVIYLIWDTKIGLFDLIFGMVGTSPTIGASYGSLWEYYFRTSLDHYSALFGMVFALNYPLAEQLFVKATGWPLVLTALIFVSLFILWCIFIYSKEKYDYNLTHAYTAILPITVYIFFRNITPSMRSQVSVGLQELGKTTLETYLLQHHIWLTSNSRTLLNLVPGRPLINFTLASILFLFVAKELFRVTMSLRNVILPNNPTVARNNAIGAAVILSIAFFAALIIIYSKAQLLNVTFVAVALALIVFVLIRRQLNSFDNSALSLYSARFIYLASACLFCGIIYNLFIAPPYSILPPSNPNAIVRIYQDVCIKAATQGFWLDTSCQPDRMSPLTAHCDEARWEWNKADCPLSRVSSVQARSMFRNSLISFIGDPSMHKVYQQFIRLLNEGSSESALSTNTRSIIRRFDNENITVYYENAFIVKNVSDIIINNQNGLWSHSLVVIGVASWDALHTNDIEKFRSELIELGDALQFLNGYVMWLLPTPVIDSLLPIHEMKMNMNNAVIAEYSKAILNSNIPQKVNAIVNPASATYAMEFTSPDGVFFSDDVYAVVVQMLLNSLKIINPNAASQRSSPPPLSPKPIGSMSFPGYGAGVLVLIAAMLILMDGFLGAGYISLAVFGRKYDWEEAYQPLHRKLGVRNGIDTDEDRRFLSSTEEDERGAQVD